MATETTLTDLVQVLVARWRFIAIVSIASLTLGAASSYLIKPRYRSEALLAPVSQDQNAGGLSQLSGSLGGLSALAGLSSRDSAKEEAIATLKSRSLTEAFVTDKSLLPILFAEQWDTQTNTWKANLKKAPSLWDANSLFAKKIRKVSEDKKTGLITVSIEWTDPDLAAQWANELVARTNKALQDRAITHAERNIAFLDDQVGKTSVVEIRASIYRLIESEIKTIMLAKGSKDYALKVIDPAVPSEEQFQMKLTSLAILGLIIGFAISVAFSLLPRQIIKTLSLETSRR